MGEQTMTVAARVKVPTLAQLVAYMKWRGWTLEGAADGLWQAYTLPREWDRKHLDIPISDNGADWKWRVRDAIECLAEIEGREPYDVAIEMLAPADEPEVSE